MLEDQSVEKIIQNIKSSQLSIKELMEYYLDRIEEYNTDIIPALMARLGPVRAALDGHGGGLILSSWEFHGGDGARKSLSLVIDLDGACVSCGAAPGLSLIHI